MTVAAMVLAAGLGTRLRPLTDECPKALVPIGDRPSLAHVLARIRDAGLVRAVVNAHHRADDVQAFARTVGDLDVRVSCERDLLGTAGGVAHAAGLLGPGDVIVYNADTFAEVDLLGLSQAHGRTGAAATLVVRPVDRGEGNVGLDGEGRVVRLRTERVADEASGAEFLGIHVLGGALRGTLPPRGCLVGDVYIPALRRGAELRAIAQHGPSFDVGTVEQYVRANRVWLAWRGGASWVGPGAAVAREVALDECVVGAGATVTGTGRLTRCVVWPGAAVRAPSSDAVVTRNGVVRAVVSAC